MLIKHIEGATRTIGKTQGYRGLPLRDEVRPVRIGDTVQNVRCMVTAWEPTPDELARIAAGAPIYLCVLGVSHPPVLLDVGDVPAVAEVGDAPC